MKTKCLLWGLLALLSIHSLAQPTVKTTEGLWTGSYGNDQKDAPYFYSMRFYTDGRMEVLNQNNSLLAQGQFTWKDNQIRIVYKYTNDIIQYECLGNLDAAGTTLSGTWRRIEDAGTKRGFTQSGRWVLRKQNPAPKTRLIKDSTRLQTIIKNVNPSVLSASALQALRFCTELPPAGNQPPPPRAATNATTYIKINPDGTLSNVGVSRQPLATYTDKMWEAGETITVGFDITGGSIDLINLVKFHAKEWELYANIKFAFQNNSNGKIRVGFNEPGSWSYIGRDALNISANKTTMNFGWLASSNAAAARQVILHEFGHALGFLHEHQRMDANIAWDKEKVYTYYAQAPNNWSREQTDQQIFQKYATAGTNYSVYDRTSIMQYAVPAELTTNGSGIGWNMELSSTDKQFAALFYPFPTPPPTARGVLKTGDDCDEVAFVVEYGVVQRDQVEILFELGSSGGRAVTWWKQISLPLINNGNYPLDIQNHSLIPAENKTSATVLVPFNQLDKNRGISFAKAKALGFHTPLGYKWNVLPAIQGGCRIRLTWIKDKCP
jgi:serralysin